MKLKVSVMQARSVKLICTIDLLCQSPGRATFDKTFDKTVKLGTKWLFGSLVARPIASIKPGLVAIATQYVRL